MTVTAMRRDPKTLTLTTEAEFDASPERVWQLWADPRQLERWWGPPSHPATVTRHDLRPGGRISYHLTGPAGDEIHHDTWDVIAVESSRSIIFHDGSANADAPANSEFSGIGSMRVTIEAIGGGRTRMSIESVFPSVEAMEQLMTMGMEAGLRGAVGQIDAILAEDLVRR